MVTRIKLRRDTAATWTATNPILAAGEPGLETDTGKIKYGDGATRWNVLEHANSDALVNEGAITIQTGDADRWLIRLRCEDNEMTPDVSDGVNVYSTAYDSEGNIIALAQINLNDDFISIFKFDSAGELIWKTALPKDTYYNEGNLAIDSSDNILFPLNQDSSSVIIVKVNGSTGAITFSQQVDMVNSYEIYGIAIDSTDKIIIVGELYNESTDNEDGFVAKLSATAETIIWQKLWETDNGSTRFKAVAVDYNDSVIITGTTWNEPTDNSIMIVAKLNSTTGADIWQKTIDVESATYSTSVGLSLDSLGGIYITGSYGVGNAETNGPWSKSNAVIIFKMSNAGAIIWDRKVGPGPCEWVGVSTAVDSDGNLYLYALTYQLRIDAFVNYDTGVFDSSLIIARYNKDTGAVVWQSYFNNPYAQEVPGISNTFGPYGSGNPNTLAVYENRIVIGGSVRFGPSDVDVEGPGSETNHYFAQGFIAQFDTDATKFSVEGWTLEPSYVPGRLTNELIATNSNLSISTGIASEDTSISISTVSTGVSVRRTASKIHTWTFDKNGTLQAPVDGNIKLNQTQLGYATMYGLWNNNDDDISYESVAHDNDGFAYVLGSNSWGSNHAFVSKFTPEGKLVWARELYSGSGASFNVEWTDNVYAIPTVNSSGGGYKVGDRIILRGDDLGGSDGVNTLVLNVATISSAFDGIGEVATVTIVSGVADGTGSTNDVYDNNDDARCEPRAITIDPVTQNVVVIASTPTFNGDTLDSEWTETLLLLIDSASGVVLTTTTLSDEGDIYPNAVAVSSQGLVAIVGEKYNEYQEFGSITPLTGSGVDILWVAKADIDSEHFPGEVGTNESDWWFTGSTITDQVRVDQVNNYVNKNGLLTRPGSGLVVEVTINGGAYTFINATTQGTNYVEGQQFKITGDLLGGATPANDLTFTVNVLGGAVSGIINISGTSGGADQVYGPITPSKINGTNASFNFDFNPTTGVLDGYGIYNSGQDFLEGDVITVLGTSFAGGTSPANNITVTVNSINSGGSIASISATGSVPSTHLLITTDNDVDFAEVGATFAIKLNLGSETFVWTPDWNKAMGSSNSDQFSGAVWNTAGTSLYAVGTGYYETTYRQALVTKWSSSGTLQNSVSINANDFDDDADYGTIALMANNNIVTVHDMYNNERDEEDEVLVTKLNSSLEIQWQQFIGVYQDESWQDPNSSIAVAVDPATDEILLAWDAYNDQLNNYAIYIVKLDTDGDIIWKRVIGVHESDTELGYTTSGGQSLSISGNQFTIVGKTDAPDENNNWNAMMVTLPLDGTGVGLIGQWTYYEPTDDEIKVMKVVREEDSFTANVNSGSITDEADIKYYYTYYPTDEFNYYTDIIRSEVGGAIEFSDGSKQTFSAAIVPQVRIGAGRYTIRPEDSGRHILVEEVDYNIILPNYKAVTLPIGFKFTVVNISGSTARVQIQYTDDTMTDEIWISGEDTKVDSQGNGIYIDDNGSGQMVTFMKIKEGTYADDGDSHGAIWMVSGTDIGEYYC
jgi:hypothetical protein